MKALANDRASRYASVSDLSADIARFLDSAPVVAYPEGPLERLLRLARKYRTPILLILAYLLMRTLLILWG